MSFYDEIEIEDMEQCTEQGEKGYSYPCPCGSMFFISLTQLQAGEEIATCPSCSLIIRVIYDPDDFQPSGSSEQAMTQGIPV